MILALAAAALRLQSAWLKPRYAVRVSLWSRCRAWPWSMGYPQRAHGVPYAVGSSAALSFLCAWPYPRLVLLVVGLAHGIRTPNTNAEV